MQISYIRLFLIIAITLYLGYDLFYRIGTIHKLKNIQEILEDLLLEMKRK